MSKPFPQFFRIPFWRHYGKVRLKLHMQKFGCSGGFSAGNSGKFSTTTYCRKLAFGLSLRYNISDMALVVVTAQTEQYTSQYIQALGDRVEARAVTPENSGDCSIDWLENAGGLYLCGGIDIHPSAYGMAPEPGMGLALCPELDTLELELLNAALERDMPVLGICRGMQLLNVAFGGVLLQDAPGHRSPGDEDEIPSLKHTVYLSPGSKLAAILGTGGFFRVNSIHHQGLKEAQKAPSLLASAYSLDDGLIEGLESPEHSWVVGVQFQPERTDEVPKAFNNLFESFKDRVEDYVAQTG